MGLDHDGTAGRAALTTPWSNARAEGQNTRLKLIERRPHGRAGFELLRRRLLRPPDPHKAAKSHQARAGSVVASPHDGDAPDHAAAVDALMSYVEERGAQRAVAAVGHRAVHGGPKRRPPRRVTAEMAEELGALGAFDPRHLPGEIRSIEAFDRRSPRVPQLACFGTGFRHDLPLVARLSPTPRRHAAQGLRRHGHGQSHAFLIEDLARVAGAEAAAGRVVLAHLGSGASLAAVREGKPVDTSMGFAPAAGVPMGTRSGDLDPGQIGHPARTERMAPARFGRTINFESGLLGLSGTSADRREPMDREAEEPRVAEAVALFCRQVGKRIGAFVAALGGAHISVFSGGIGESAPATRARIRDGLGFLGTALEARRDAQGSPLIPPDAGGVRVRVIAADEASMSAKPVATALDLDARRMARVPDHEDPHS